MDKISLIVLMSILFSYTLFAKEISLSFDDAPRGGGYGFSGMERTEKIIDELPLKDN